MPRLELKATNPTTHKPAALSDPARLLTKEEIMKVLETIFAVLAWTVFGIVIWAVSPFLMKLMEMATNLHNLFK
jgi:type IV secretory pathway TrbD component